MIFFINVSCALRTETECSADKIKCAHKNQINYNKNHLIGGFCYIHAFSGQVFLGFFALNGTPVFFLKISFFKENFRLLQKIRYIIFFLIFSFCLSILLILLSKLLICLSRAFLSAFTD